MRAAPRPSPSSPENASLSAWRAVHQTNLDGVFLGCKHAIRAMRAQGAGAIINISSRSGLVGIPGAAAYASSKGGLNALTKSLCAEWARFNVQVNAICPTVVMTPMGREVWGAPEKGDPFRNATPARRFAEPVEVADAALYLASGAALFLYAFQSARRRGTLLHIGE